MCKEMWLAALYATNPFPRTPAMIVEGLVFHHRPPQQVCVEVLEDSIQG